MHLAFRKIYLVIIFSSLLVYLGCSSSANSSRYGENTDEENSGEHRRFSSYEDERSITLNEDNYDDYGCVDTEESSNNSITDISGIVEEFNLSGIEYKDSVITVKEIVLSEIVKYLNTPYKYGGTSTSGIDCSAFTQNVFKKTLSTDLLRSARDQFSQGEIISTKNDLKFGDLVFFDTQRSTKPGHVGIYIGDELFAHASTTKGVTITPLNQSYYLNRFVGGRRITPEGTF